MAHRLVRLRIPGGGVGAVFALACAVASTVAGPAEAAKKHAAAAPDFAALCQQGNAKYAAKDYAGAIELYQKAIQAAPDQALGQYLLGEAQLAAGDLPSAEVALHQAADQAGEKDAALHGKALFLLADMAERHTAAGASPSEDKKWEQAKAGWQAYVDFAEHHAKAAPYVASAKSRLQVIDAMLKQDASTEVVRQRIAQTKAGNVFTDPTKTPPSS